MKFLFALITLSILLSSSLLHASETMIIGHQYEIPIDCGHQAYFKPEYHKAIDEMDEAERILHLRYFQGEKGDSVSVKSIITADDYSKFNNIQSFVTSSLHYSYSQEALQYQGGCINGKLIASSPHIAFNAKISSDIIYRRAFFLPTTQNDEAYSFYAHVAFSQHDFLSHANKDTQVSITLSCRDYQYTRKLDNPGVGKQVLTIPMGEFNLAACSTKEQVELKVLLRGNALQLEGLQAMYYEAF